MITISKWVQEGDIFFFLAVRMLRARVDGVQYYVKSLSCSATLHQF
jgi:hypothetical protein